MHDDVIVIVLHFSLLYVFYLIMCRTFVFITFIILLFFAACCICTELGKGGKANAGACMQCNKSGCKQQFHVTCAQQLGLLCEEAGNYLDNVKYCGYCQHHYSKLVSILGASTNFLVL